MPLVEGLLKATDFSLDQLLLVGSSGVAVSLIEVVRELNIFEDLFNNTMTGNILINDAQNLINVIPIIGTEYLVIRFSKPSTPWMMSKTFRVYKITDRKRNSLSSEDYVLHFCSEELVLSESIKISKAYKGMTISDMVEDIASTFLNINSTKFPSSELAPTIGTFDVVIPFWTPFYAINWLSRMARTGQTPGCSFLFFEDGAGFHFNSIETLSQQLPLQSINFMPMNFEGEKNDTVDTVLRLEGGEQYQLAKSPDTLQLIQGGLFAGKLIRVHPLDQTILFSSADGSALFSTTEHVNDNSFLPTVKDRTQVQQTQHFDAFFRVAADHNRVETWMLQRNAYLSGMHGFQIHVSLPGNMNFRVGQVVELNIPAALSPTRETRIIDTLYSGKYLITAIRHKVDRTKYVCVLELSKDSLAAPLPVSADANPALSKLRNS